MKTKILILLLLISTNILAAPVAPGFRLFYQHDGGSFEAEGHGDEYFNWMEDKLGRVIEYNPASYNFEYSVLIEKDGELILSHSGVAASDYTPLGVSSSLGSKTPIIAIEKSTLTEIVNKNILNSALYLQNIKMQKMNENIKLYGQLDAPEPNTSKSE
jgi:hypothetical protein